MDWLRRGLFLVPWPQVVVDGTGEWCVGKRLTIALPTGADDTVQAAAAWLAEDLARLVGASVGVGSCEEADIRLVLGGRAPQRPEAYALNVGPDGVIIAGADAAGLCYGMQTLAQLVAFARNRGHVPSVFIEDWPQYALRAVMLDPGRASHPLPLLERVVRVMARLKLNMLHLHVHDNELNGVRYDTLPLGSENPTALSISDYAALIQYAKRYHVQVMPELEAWGHVDSLLYHYPELTGVVNQFGRSFAMGEPTYVLLEAMLAEWMSILEGDPVMVHVGLDEADWSLLDSVPEGERDRYTPVTHIQRMHEMLQRLASKQGKRVEMHLWADHGGRPLPEGIEGVVIEPWQYHISGAEDIKAKVLQYGGAGKTPFVMGAGASVVHDQGVFAATQLFCREAQGVGNCRGVAICIWGSNDIAGRLVSVFAGADAAWTPNQPVLPEHDPRDERLRGDLVRQMRYWQACFPDVSGEALDADRGPEVVMGRYANAERLGELVGPTAGWED